MSKNTTNEIQPENIPDELKQLGQWVNWHGVWDEKKKKLNKIPKKHDGRAGSSTDENTWTSFVNALSVVGQRYRDGIGLAGLERTPFTGLDIDSCVNPETGAISPYAMELVKEFSSYTEYTVSGTGLRILIEAKKPPGSWCASKNAEREIEVYDRGRFFTVTGLHLEGTPKSIERRQEALLTLLEREAPPPKPKPERKPYNGSPDYRLELDEFLQESGVMVLGLIRSDQSSERAYTIVCPWLHEHTGGDTSGTRVGQYATGALWFQCDHGHCDGRKWEHFRERLDPEAYRRGDAVPIYLNGHKEEEPIEGGVASNPLVSGLVDLAVIIENGIEPPAELEPGILLRGRVHHIFAPAGVGKTYLVLWLITRCLSRGQKVLYLDAENGPRIISERLGQMGVSTEEIREYLYYLPFPTLDMSKNGHKNYMALIEKTEPVLVVFDSWIKFLSSAGLEENDNDHIAKWAAHFLQPIRNADITSAVLDHVPHDGTRSRGASRKRDEVDVQYALIKTKHFDRANVGEIHLRLEKDREGWLPQSSTFSIGGSENGFVFSQSSGTIDGPGEIVVKGMERIAFDALVHNFGSGGARHNEWLKTCVPKAMGESSFKRAKNDLIRVHLVRREDTPNGPKYYPKSGPRGSKGDGPDFSPQIWEIPDRVQEGPNRVHGPDGNEEGPQGPHPLGGGPMDPTHEPRVQNDELVERVRQAFEYGNAPKKALEHYRDGGQDMDAVVKSVMHYYARGKDDPGRWYASVVFVVGAMKGGS
jgi:hypothetical protein